MSKMIPIALFALLALAGCNTVKGAGQDVRAGGEAISETADEVQDDM